MFNLINVIKSYRNMLYIWGSTGYTYQSFDIGSESILDIVYVVPTEMR
jgi:hypothetical protein